MPDDPAGAKSQWMIAPYFIVDNVVATARFYSDRLGFHFDRYWGDPPAFCMVKRGGIIIMLSQFSKTGLMRPNGAAIPHGDAWDAYVWVENADALQSEFQDKGVKIARGICDQPYGMRDFDVEDLNGYRLCFGHSISD